ncbi:hypothetical protein [Xanthomonas nasturtii]|uniref:DUF2384 domain-containing protein n=1 Tax=Xanthomonas nasturtii TaxID=1843581 RepID=A0ABT0LWI3_9XANT|nr:hypothetical protein [Xanthomonas nasturtii]MCL1536456.1 hypothetical protein [Xanthomonas nasturtii]MCL1545766.1 hypothetical protein [Xanthomonas nasturtii]MCL1553693.1 hypothetical protein [Xanthomonas nasturtii]MCL1561098.1 hypothetical protein [Xanthomonas nasturtii]
MINQQDWENFVATVSSEWVLNDITVELLKLTGDQEISIAIWACLRSHSLSWIFQGIPVANGRRPIDLLKDEGGRDELRWMLLSNPWW